ncbi:MAG: response regulator [Bacteroidales bacterium]
MSEPLSILYVDDEKLNLELFRINFRKNYKVYTASSGFEGLEKLNECNDINVVISDMKMPGMNGVEFIRKAKASYDKAVYFILTGFDLTDEISDAIKDNLVCKYFRKPFNLREIEVSIQSALKL